MLDKIRLIALGAALLASGWIGYGVGSSRNDTARTQLRALEEAARVAETRHRTAQQQLGEELKSREAAHEARMRELRLAFDEQKAEMIDALDETQQRLDELASRRRVNDGELQTVRKALVAATGAHREELREREARLAPRRRERRNEPAGVFPDDSAGAAGRGRPGWLRHDALRGAGAAVAQVRSAGGDDHRLPDAAAAQGRTDLPRAGRGASD
jgi:hypothetical protein